MRHEIASRVDIEALQKALMEEGPEDTGLLDLGDNALMAYVAVNYPHLYDEYVEPVIEDMAMEQTLSALDRDLNKASF